MSNLNYRIAVCSVVKQTGSLWTVRNVLFMRSNILQSGNHTAAGQNERNKKGLGRLLSYRLFSAPDRWRTSELWPKRADRCGQQAGKTREKNHISQRKEQPGRLQWCDVMLRSLPTSNNKSVLIKNCTLFIFIFMSASQIFPWQVNEKTDSSEKALYLRLEIVGVLG